MSRFLTFLMSLFLCMNLCAQSPSSGAELVRQMHSRFYQAPCKTYIFSQKNLHYKGDTVSGRSVWHEAMDFPDKFMIIFGEVKNGNRVLFRNDSLYSFRKGALVDSRPDTNMLMLVLGGMYYRPIEDVLSRLTRSGYDLLKLSDQKWDGRPVFVIGAQPGDTISNQIWVEQGSMKVLRIIEKMSDKDRMDMRLESHQEWCKGTVENKVSFRRNGKLEQVEEYFDLRQVKKFPEPSEFEMLWPARETKDK